MLAALAVTAVAWLGLEAVQQSPRPLQEALADLEAGRLSEAERKLSAMLRQKPDWADANFYLGVARFRAGRIEEARPVLERASQLTPSRAPVWKALGAVYAAAGRLELALEAFKRACELDPEEEDACYYLGRNLYTLNRFEPALAAFEKARRAGPEQKQWRVERGMGQALEALGYSEEAERQYREAVKHSRGQARPDEDPRIDLGTFLFRQGRPEESLGPLQEAVKAAPSSARAQGELGRSLLQLERLEAAATHLEKAVQLDPRYWAAHLLLGKAYFRLGRVEDGERHTRMGEKGLAAENYGSSRDK